MKRTKWLLCLGLVLSANVQATEACKRFTTSYDKTYCTAKLFVESDTELNQVYKELKSKLKEDVAKGLTRIQRDWIQYRNATCSDRTEIDVACNYQVNRGRTEYLRDRLRECKTGNCDSTAITRQSW